MTQQGDQVGQLSDEVTNVAQDESDMESRVAAAEQDLQKQIDDLKAHPASADLTTQIAGLEAVRLKLKAVNAPPAPTADANAQQS